MSCGTWEVRLSPHVPTTNALILGETLVCPFYYGFGAVTRIAQNNNGEWFRLISSASFAPSDDAACVDFGLLVKCRFEIFRIDVQAGGGDDYVAFASLEKQVAGFIDGANVSGVKPFACAAIGLTRAGPVTGRYTVAAHDDL